MPTNEPEDNLLEVEQLNAISTEFSQTDEVKKVD